GDGFTSIQYQNANNSVRVSDKFMRAVEAGDEWKLTSRTTGKPIGDPLDARALMNEIAEAAWRCADPGVQYDTTINQWHTCPNSCAVNLARRVRFVCGKTWQRDPPERPAATILRPENARADGELALLQSPSASP